MIRRMLMAIGAVLGLLAIAPVAHAASSVTTDAHAYRPGSTVVISAAGFTACTGKTITFTLTPPGNGAATTLTSTVSATGTATVNVTAPNTPGAWKLRASSSGCGPATTKFVIQQPIYPPGQGTTVASDAGVYTPGSSAILVADGFLACAGQTVTFTITPPGGGTPIVLTAIADATGLASVSFTVPSTTGTYTVVASSPGCPDATSSFVVRLLPATGSDSQSWLGTAGIIAAVGVGLVLVAWRRRRPAA